MGRWFHPLLVTERLPLLLLLLLCLSSTLRQTLGMGSGDPELDKSQVCPLSSLGKDGNQLDLPGGSSGGPGLENISLLPGHGHIISFMSISFKRPAGEWQSHAWKAGLSREPRDPDQALSLCKPHNDIEDKFFSAA